MSAWVPWFFCFLPQSKDVHVRFSGSLEILNDPWVQRLNMRWITHHLSVCLPACLSGQGPDCPLVQSNDDDFDWEQGDPRDPPPSSPGIPAGNTCLPVYLSVCWCIRSGLISLRLCCAAATLTKHPVNVGNKERKCASHHADFQSVPEGSTERKGCSSFCLVN